MTVVAGIRVPDGFCVTTEAYQSIIGQIVDFKMMMDRLSLLNVEDRGAPFGHDVFPLDRQDGNSEETRDACRN